ncbi:MAG: hypothetical protein OXM61_06345 [Candidatus Poribacteria bacterium]|nr:hypothetical protein [Candidatus Poribacteria bacterium]
MQPTQGVTASAFRMKFFKLLFFASLSAIIILTGCERRLVSPIAPTDPSQTTSQFAQSALSNLADTAAERGFVDLANAANEVAEVLAIETGTTTETVFWKLFQEANALQQGFALANCGIKLGGFAIATERAARAYAAEAAVELNDREQVLENLSQEALNAKKVLQQFPTENPFIPFAFGHAPYIDSYEDYILYIGPTHPPDIIWIQFDETIHPATETWTAVVEFLILKGYIGQVKGYTEQWESLHTTIRNIGLGVDVDSIMEELDTIPGVARAGADFTYIPIFPPTDFSSSYPILEIMGAVRKKYNEAWCQGNFDTIDSILIEEIGLDFFNYAFVRYLADIYAEEIPEAADRIRTNGFSLRSIAIGFYAIHSQNQEKGHEEIIELFRQFIRDGLVTIDRSGWASIEQRKKIQNLSW